MKKKYFFTLLGFLSAILIVVAIKVKHKITPDWNLENLSFSENMVQLGKG